MRTRPFRSIPHSDQGAALGLVLVMIVLLSLMVVSVSFLTQTTSKSIAINAAESKARAELVDNALSQSLRYMADPAKSCGGDIPTKFDITISCVQAPKSGQVEPLGSLALLGQVEALSDCPVGERTANLCQIGLHGGLAIECSQADCNGTYPNPLTISAGVVNTSSAWKNVSPKTLLLEQANNKDDPKLVNQEIRYDTDGTVFDDGCPSRYFYSVVCGQPGFQECPLVKTTNAEFASDECLSSSKLSAKPEVTLPSTTVKNYLDFVASKELMPKPKDPASVSVNRSVCTWSPGILNYAKRQNQESSTLDILLSEMSEGSSCRTIVFKSGVYYFDSQDSAFLWQIQDFGGGNSRTVIGGTPAGTDCDAQAPGVQFMFANKSRISLLGGTMSLCPLTPGKSNSPVISTWQYLNPPPSIWDGSGNSTFLSVDCTRESNPKIPVPARWGGDVSLPTGPDETTSTLNIHGLVLAPDGGLDANLNKVGNMQTKIRLDSGGIFKAARFFLGGGTFSTPLLEMPKSYNGDRVIQLKLWRGNNLSVANRTQDKILGFVQVRIYDYFGRKPNSGYKILTWRAAW